VRLLAHFSCDSRDTGVICPETIRFVLGRGNRDLAHAVEEMKESNREILLRNEKVYTGVIVRLEELSEESRASTEQTRSNTEETKAQTKALLKLIDRFDEKT
jgi:cell division protein ZapA (FtsZ GTPase activity inhibitor)